MGWYVDDTPGSDNDDFNKKRGARPGDPPNTEYPDSWREADPANPAVDPKTGKGNPVFDYTIEWKCSDCGKTGKAAKLPTTCPDCGEENVEATGYTYTAKLDLYTAIKHEFGHALGLKDAPEQKGDVMHPDLDAGERKHLTQRDINAFERVYWCQCPDAKCKTTRNLPKKSETSEVVARQKFLVTVLLNIMDDANPPTRVKFWEEMPEGFSFVSGTPTPTSCDSGFAEWVFYGEDVKDICVSYYVVAADIPGTYYFDGYQETYGVTVVTLGDYVISVSELVVGGISVASDKSVSLTPDFGLAVTILATMIASTGCIQRGRRSKANEKCAKQPS